MKALKMSTLCAIGVIVSIIFMSFVDAMAYRQDRRNGHGLNNHARAVYYDLPPQRTMLVKTVKTRDGQLIRVRLLIEYDFASFLNNNIEKNISLQQVMSISKEMLPMFKDYGWEVRPMVNYYRVWEFAHLQLSLEFRGRKIVPVMTVFVGNRYSTEIVNRRGVYKAIPRIKLSDPRRITYRPSNNVERSKKKFIKTINRVIKRRLKGLRPETFNEPVSHHGTVIISGKPQ